MSERNNIPYKIYLEESEMPKAWYNVRADMKNKPAPLLNPGTLRPMTAEDLAPVFCEELVRQELDDTTAYIPIPQEIQDFYKMYRLSPLVRAYCLEKALNTPAKIYYKFEGNNTSGSHKLNSAIAQAYYAKQQGLIGVTTETGAGQWGTALSMVCSYFGLDSKVYMVKVSYEQKPFRREVMRTYGASVTPSPSAETQVGRKILAEHPGTTGSLAKMYTLGSGFIPSAIHAGGLRYHGMNSILSQLYHDGLMEAVSVEQTKVFEAAEQFARIEGILPEPESSHAIRVAVDEALRCRETGEEKTILFGLTGTGYFDLTAYEKFHNGEMSDYVPSDAELQISFDGIPKFPGDEID